MVTRERKAVVCKRGHVGHCRIELNEEYRGDPNCGECGNKFLINCSSCGYHIKGKLYDDDEWLDVPFSPNNNCINCGKSYPWKNRFKFLRDIRFSNIKNKIGKAGTIIAIIASIIASIIVVLQFIFELV